MLDATYDNWDDPLVEAMAMWRNAGENQTGRGAFTAW
jgi:hypothetical protein